MAEIIVVHGTPGAGKSTHSKHLAQLIVNEHFVFHISAGDRLRAVRTNQVHSRFSEEINNPTAPAMLDHCIVNGLIFEFVETCPERSIILVDGYPRFVDAVEPFMKALHESGNNLLGCLDLEISKETSLARLTQRGMRRGERFIGGISEEVVEKRYSEHVEFTLVAVKEIGRLSHLITIDAEPNENEVWRSFCDSVLELSKSTKNK